MNPLHQTLPVVGISSCLLGEAVRYDGDHKVQNDLLAELSPFVDWRSFCPEMAAGLGVPRPPVKLVTTSNGVRARNEKLNLDCTDALTETSSTFWTDPKSNALCGYIFKSRSPSCGLESTPLFNESGFQTGLRSGLFASQAQISNPQLPMAEEAWLTTPERRLRFLSACYLVFLNQASEQKSENFPLGDICGERLGNVEDYRDWIPLLLADEQNSALEHALQYYWDGFKRGI